MLMTDQAIDAGNSAASLRFYPPIAAELSGSIGDAKKTREHHIRLHRCEVNCL